MSTYHYGDLVRVTGSWTSLAGTALDPTVVKCQIRAPDGTVTTLTYNTDVTLVKGSTGVYYTDIDANQMGRWYYRFYSTGTGQASNETSFLVDRSVFS